MSEVTTLAAKSLRFTGEESNDSKEIAARAAPSAGIIFAFGHPRRWRVSRPVIFP